MVKRQGIHPRQAGSETPSSLVGFLNRVSRPVGNPTGWVTNSRQGNAM